MTKLSFNVKNLNHGFGLAKVIKPETNDFCIRFSNYGMEIFSYNKRRYTLIRVPHDGTKSVDNAYMSDEYYISNDKAAFFSSELTTALINIDDFTLSIKISGNGQNRKASIKKRSGKSMRSSIPEIDINSFVPLNRSEFNLLLKQIMCSVLKGESEEDLRLNQVHFYPERNCALASTGYYGTVVYFDGMSLDLSIAGSDIPFIKSFCSKCSGEFIGLKQDDRGLFVIDPSTNSFLFMSKISVKKPKLYILDEDKFETEIVINKDLISKNLNWAELAIEGTQRLTFIMNVTAENNGQIEFRNANQEISKFEGKFLKGNKLIGDFPVRFLNSIVKYIDGDEVILKFNHSEHSNIMSISKYINDGSVRYTHYLSSMKPR